VVSDIADVMYKQDRYYADETERGSGSTIPMWGSSGPFRAMSYSRRSANASAPTLAEVADELPFSSSRAQRGALSPARSM